jgi:hypothetical protein
MPNPNPKTEYLKPVVRQDSTTDQLATTNTAVRLPIDIDTAVRSLPNRSAWLRRVITEAARRELLADSK